MTELEIIEVGQLSLFELAEIANTEHALACAAGVSMLEHAWLSGEALLKAKRQVTHGDWEEWIDQNFVASLRTAQRWMQIAKAPRVAFLDETSVRGAVKAIETGDKQDARREREERLRITRANAEEEARQTGFHHHLEIADIHTWRPLGVDSIITDPPYVGDSIPLYAALRDFAVDVLPAGGPLVVMAWQAILPDVIKALDHPDLAYRWTICWRYETNESTVDYKRRVFDCWKPILVYHKTAMPTDAPMFMDAIANPNLDKDHHAWGQALEGFNRLAKSFSWPGQTICDPFLGGGTTAIAALTNHCNFIGADIDPEAIAITERRLA